MRCHGMMGLWNRLRLEGERELSYIDGSGWSCVLRDEGQAKHTHTTQVSLRPLSPQFVLYLLLSFQNSWSPLCGYLAGDVATS